MELEHKYSEKIYSKRLEVYPTLYRTLSNFDKRITESQITKDFIKETYDKIIEWGSNNAIYVSHSIIVILVKIRKTPTKELLVLEGNDIKRNSPPSIFSNSYYTKNGCKFHFHKCHKSIPERVLNPFRDKILTVHSIHKL